MGPLKSKLEELLKLVVLFLIMCVLGLQSHKNFNLFVSPCPPECYYKAKRKLSLVSG